jgi:hypothetical protein
MATRKTTADSIIDVESSLIEPANIVSAEEIAKRAYQIYENRGYMEGSDLDDWLQAERELTQQAPGVRRAAAGQTAG